MSMERMVRCIGGALVLVLLISTARAQSGGSTAKRKKLPDLEDGTEARSKPVEKTGKDEKALAELRAGMEPAAEPASELSEELMGEEPKEIFVGGERGWVTMKYMDITDAVVGDTLVFKYLPYHNVWRVAKRKCNFVDGERLASRLESPFRMVLEEPGTFHISDSILGHCRAGKLFTVTVREP